MVCPECNTEMHDIAAATYDAGVTFYLDHKTNIKLEVCLSEFCNSFGVVRMMPVIEELQP